MRKKMFGQIVELLNLAEQAKPFTDRNDLLETFLSRKLQGIETANQKGIEEQGRVRQDYMA